MSERKTKDQVQCKFMLDLKKSDFYAISALFDFELTDDVWESIIAKKQYVMSLEDLNAEPSQIKMFKLALAAKIIGNNELMKEKHG
jgi:hypothetical protein|nr:MAG TPA: hypothetical protein [Caudoviricetes sp.]